MFLFAAKKEPKNRRRFRRGGRTTKGPAGPLETHRLAPGDPVRFGQGNARLAVQAHAPETPVFRPPIENGEQRFPIPLRGRLPQASIRPELPEAGKGLSMLPFMCGHIQCRLAFRCFSFLHSGFLSRLWDCLSFAHPPYKVWKTRCVPNRCLCTEETTNVKLPHCVKALSARSKNHQCKITGARKGITHTRQKPLAESHRTGTSHPTPMEQTFLLPARFRSQEALRK